MTDYIAGVEQAWEEPQGVRYVWICHLCGQPLPQHDECNSGIHVGPDGGPRGYAVKSINVVRDYLESEGKGFGAH